MKEKSILVILIAGIGDLVLASKALRALKNGHPDSSLHLLTSIEAAELAVNYAYINKVWSFPVRQLRRKKTAYFKVFSLLLKMRSLYFNRAINLYHVDSWAGAIKMGAIFLSVHADEKIGHDRHGMGLFLDKQIPAGFFDNRHIAAAMTEMVVIAGGIADERGIEVFWEKESERRCQHLFNFSQEYFLPFAMDEPLKPVSGLIPAIDPAAATLRQRHPLFVGINPGGDRANRRWPIERYATVGNKIAATLNARILIFGGPGEEQIAGSIQGKMKSEVVNLAGNLSINDLAYVISRLDLLITNDSGPMHIAAATKTPVVAIFGPEDPVLMRPYTSEDLYRVIYKPLPCRPCQKDQCARPLCLEAITPDEVLSSCMELLAKLGKMKVEKGSEKQS
ncbi:MAG: glycosyltransferase family 9 protein [Syntrophales bacterium]